MAEPRFEVQSWDDFHAIEAGGQLLNRHGLLDMPHNLVMQRFSSQLRRGKHENQLLPQMLSVSDTEKLVEILGPISEISVYCLWGLLERFKGNPQQAAVLAERACDFLAENRAHLEPLSQG